MVLMGFKNIYQITRLKARLSNYQAFNVEIKILKVSKVKYHFSEQNNSTEAATQIAMEIAIGC